MLFYIPGELVHMDFCPIHEGRHVSETEELDLLETGFLYSIFTAWDLLDSKSVRAKQLVKAHYYLL